MAQGSIRQRSKNSWEITVFLGRNASGGQVRRFLTIKGTKTDAQRRLRELLGSLDKGLPIDSSKLTLGVFLAQWQRDYVNTNTRPRTSESYAAIIRNRLTPPLGHIQLQRLQPSDVQAMEARLLELGAATKTVRNIHLVLNESLRYAVRKGILYRNVCDAVDVPRLVRPEINVPKTEQVWELLEVAKDTPYYAPLCFAAFTGCRRGEVLGLRWRDVDLGRGTASIVQTLQRIEGRGLIFQPPKSMKSRRAIALDSSTVAMIREHQGQQLLHKMELRDIYDDHDLVFPGSLGRPLDPSVLTRQFERLARRVGMEGVRLHDLRHHHATLLLQANTHPKIVQERLGHSTVAITLDLYSHVVPGLQEKAAETFNEAMQEARNKVP